MGCDLTRRLPAGKLCPTASGHVRSPPHYGQHPSYNIEKNTLYDMQRTSVDYKRFADTYYVRLDKGDEVISSILDICREEHIGSAIYSGIGGCSEAQIQTFLPEAHEFETQTLSGMLELVSLNGNVVSSDEGELYHHTHAAFSYKKGDEHFLAAGHIKSITVLYTAEIELRPVVGGTIRRRHDPETGTGFWSFSE